ncbi:amidase family protein [Streptomyces sp. NPDC053431]|uniref:amidase family protein n=1 Tax=Streptomyces sp. NPDC053431 TaxID=3365703 RepID=UPI0037D22AE7
MADNPRGESRVSGFPALTDLHRRLRGGTLTSTALTRLCLDRIAAVNPVLSAVLAVDATALEQAAEADRRYAAGAPLGPLDGIPVLIKDSIDTAGLASTAGSRLLATAPPRQDAAVVTRLRRAGAVVLGKTNLTEWSSFRTTQGCEGWSAVGGQTVNPYSPQRTASGSSSGSAVAVATGMAPLALGAETDGSIVSPAGVCGVVGLKPAPGTLPLDGVVPVSDTEDSVGLLAGRVADAALALDVLTSGAPAPGAPASGAPASGAPTSGVPLASGAPPAPGSDPALAAHGPLGGAGRRLGLWRVPRMPAQVGAVLDAAAGSLRAAGFTVVDVEIDIDREILVDGLRAMYAEFTPSLEKYLAGRDGVPRTLAEIVEANRVDPVELSLFGQDLFETVLGLADADRAKAEGGRARAVERAVDLLDGTLRRYGVEAVVAPTNEPAWLVDHQLGDPYSPGSSTLPALARRPNVTVPAAHGGLPVGISLFGPAEEGSLLRLALEAEHALARQPHALLV